MKKTKNRKGLKLLVNGTDFDVQLYNTVVYSVRKNEAILNSGGYRTNHTKNSINDYIPMGYRVFQTKNVWYVQTPTNIIEFKDGMKIAV